MTVEDIFKCINYKEGYNEHKLVSSDHFMYLFIFSHLFTEIHVFFFIYLGESTKICM